MVLLNDLKTFKLDYAQLDNIAYYYWMSEYILTHFVSDVYTLEVMPDIPGFGAHWGGLFVSLKDKAGTQKALCHTGLVYHPATETGVYFEVESFKNTANFQKLWRDVEPDPGYDLNKEEPDFLKFFFPRDKVNDLMSATTVSEQMDIMTKYLDACFTGVFRAANK